MSIYLCVCFSLILVWFLFYGLSTHFRSFRARSVTQTILFLGKPPRQFTSTSIHSFASNWQLLFLYQQMREDGRKLFFVSNFSRQRREGKRNTRGFWKCVESHIISLHENESRYSLLYLFLIGPINEDKCAWTLVLRFDPRFPLLPCFPPHFFASVWHIFRA